MEEREIVVDTQLVRLMKSRQLMKHHELVQDCIKMITIFKPDVNFIKKRIESLIEREYLRRDELDLNTYSYVN
jgi:CRISPR/Cas system-associated endonuclease Cas1